jgi:hypothetical protein
MLPKRSAGPSPGVKAQHHDFLGFMEYMLDQQRMLRPDQGMPMVRHQDIAAEQKP